MILKPHQEEAVAKIQCAFQMHPAFLLADEMGLGKTRVACALAKEFTGKILIVAPLSTFAGWMDEADAVGLQIGIAGIMWPHTKATLINYERMERYREVLDEEFSLVVWDESHKLKSYKSKRHKLWEKMRLKASRMLYMTATPGQDPLDLKYLMDVIGLPQPMFWPWIKSFKGMWKPRWGGFKYRPGHIEDERKLAGIVTGNPRALRRLPSDIAGWPELKRIIYPIQLTPSGCRQYEEAFEAYLDTREELGKRRHTKADELVAVGQFRKAASLIKVQATHSLAVDLLEQGKVVTIACEYLGAAEMLKTLLHSYRVATISGEVPTADRMEVLHRSKFDELDVIVFTVQEGINLQQFEDSHRERVQIDHDIRWSALAQHQVDGRTHRAGRTALNYWMTLKATVDEKVALKLKERIETLNIINGDTVDMDAVLAGENDFFKSKEKELILV